MTGQIPIYYINLATRPDRRAFIETQLYRLGLVATRVKAVRTDEVGEDRLAPQRNLDNPWAVSPVEIACGLSHERAWQLMLDGGQAHALVLEDDIVLGDAVKPLVAPGLAEEIGADLIRFETMLRRIRLGRPAKTVGRFAACRMLTSQMGAAAYIISAQMARRALADPLLRRMSVDRYLFSLGGPIVPSRGLFQIDPAPAIQLEQLRDGDPEARSDLAPERTAHRATVPRSLAYRLTDQLARIRYSLRSAVHTLRDPVALRSGRRIVPFDPNP